MKKARNKYSFCLILLFAFGCFESKAQIADNLTSSYLDNNFNPKVLEITFEKKPQIIKNKKAKLPHKLDSKNNPDDRDIKLIFKN